MNGLMLPVLVVFPSGWFPVEDRLIPVPASCRCVATRRTKLSVPVPVRRGSLAVRDVIHDCMRLWYT